MRKIILVCLSVLPLIGCAEAIMSHQVQNRQSQEQVTRDAYFANPKNKVMITIDPDSEWLTYAQCNVSIGSATNLSSSSNSFNITPPFTRVSDMQPAIDAMKDNLTKNGYAKLNETQKAEIKFRIATQLPSISYICQSQSEVGLIGKLYFDGKVVSSSEARVNYGAITLQFSVPTELVLPSE